MEQNLDIDTINIPTNEIYKICFLDSNGIPKRMIVFEGKTREITKDDEVFSEEERLQLSIDQPEITSSSQQIHKDDSIRIIKKKIIKEIGINNISYDELYLFSTKRDKLHLLKSFLEMTNNGEIAFNKHMAGQFIMNILTDAQIDKAKILIEMNQKSYSYETFMKLLNNNTESETETYDLLVPIGRKFSNARDYLFSANPFSILPGPDVIYEPLATNKLITFDNHLLLNYGNINNNTIYVCFANDVLNYGISNNISEEYLMNLYFPLLKEKDILSKSALMDSKETLIKQSQMIMTEKSMRIYDVVDLYYNVFYSRKTEIPYIKKGIKSFHLILHPEFQTVLPLDIIFKQFHVNTEIPFIKYNPGSRREAVYRLYSKNRTQNGKKIPYLTKAKITSLSKEPSKGHRLHFFVQNTVDNVPITVYLDIDYNGNVIVRSEFNEPTEPEFVENILKAVLNPIIEKINRLLESNGYILSIFESIDNDFIEIINIEYNFLIDYRYEIKLSEYTNFLSTAFEIIDKNIEKGAILKYKRVENYRKMDAIDAMITNIFKKNDNEKNVIEALKVNFTMSEDEAILKLRDYLNQHIRIGGQFVNKTIDIAENPGFPVVIRTIPFENKLLIEISDINNINFLPILNIYIDSLLRITQYPESSFITKAQIVEKSTNIQKTKDEPHIDNVIMPDIQPFRLQDKDIEEEGILFEEEEDDEEEEYQEDEEEGGILFEEDDEDEDEEINDDDQNDKDEVVGEPDDDEINNNGILFEDSDDEEDDEDLDENDEEKLIIDNIETINKQKQTGGANIFFKKMKEKEPTLFLSKKEGNFNAYSRACPANLSRQPVILTDKEKQDIDDQYPGSYEVALPYSTQTDKKYWYICPRYWCVKKNRPMTEQQFKDGECDNIKTVDNKNVFEFTDEKEHKDKQGNYRQHRPGFLDNDAHPDPNTCVPCCFKNMNTEYQIRRRKECSIQDADLSTGKQYNEKKVKQLVTSFSELVEAIRKYLKEYEKLSKTDIDNKLKEWEGREFDLYEELKSKYQEQTDENIEESPVDTTDQYEEQEQKQKQRVKNIIHILGFDKVPINQYRWGFLPISVELFLNTDSSYAVTKKNAAVLKPNATPILRYGVEQTRHQSFLGCISDVYSYYHKDFIPTIENIRKILLKNMTIDIFLKSNNGSLVSVFDKTNIKSKFISDIHVENYKNTVFYKSFTDFENPAQNRFLKDTIQAYENFLEYIKDPDSFIDHTYLWDIITMNESILFEGGVNLIIMEIVDNDITDNVEILCPTNSYNGELYNRKKGTILLLKQGEFYEPIYKYGKTNSDESRTANSAVKVFKNNNTPKILLETFELIKRSMKNYCKPQASINGYQTKTKNINEIKLYEFKQNISAAAVVNILKQTGLVIKEQISNYRGKIIGVMVSNKELDNEHVFVPTFPSAHVNNLQIKYIDDVVWLSYEMTIKKLSAVHSVTNGEIRCKPKMRLVEDGLIVGILTETNQFVQLAEPYETNDVKYGGDFIEVVSYKDKGAENGYHQIDKKLATVDTKDEIRIKTIRNISLETQFYLAFRIKIRNLLNDFVNKDIRKKIIDIIDNVEYSYTYKLKNIIKILVDLTSDQLSFVEISEDALSKLSDLNSFNNFNDIKTICFTKNNTICLPSKNLIDSKNNKVFYFSKMADELLRYNRIRTFIFEPKNYLNITNIDYSIHKDEILLLQSVLFGNYFDNLIPYNMNQYIQNINYDNANPMNNNQRIQKVPLNKQHTMNKNTTKLDDFNECIGTPVLVIENTGSDGKNWRAIFPENTKEFLISDSILCSYYPILYVINKHLGIDESVESLKTKLLKEYEKYYKNYNLHFHGILSIQGKKDIVSILKKGGILDLQPVIMSDSYFLTNLDLWLLASSMKLPIVLFSSNKIANLTYQYDWFVLGGDVAMDKFYFIRCGGENNANDMETYHLIDGSFHMNELPGFELLSKDPDYDKHMSTITDYLNTYPIKINLKR
uniref:Uncharacterized protein n=1 Tax=viral metagenome TaxID=1070528 RepID=A0A6C0DEM8_9ZZZZ